MEPFTQSDDHVTDEQAVALFEGRVDEAMRQRIDAHLDVCDECRELVGALALTGGPETQSAPDISLSDLPEDGSVTLLRSSSGPSRPSGQPPGEGAPLERGDMVDHFRVMRTLGRGAMGEVYLARDTKLGRKVALKIIAPDLLGSDKAVRRFLFEARATARFNHPNIVTIHAVGEYEGRPWVALEYVEGENLRERARRERPPLRETLRIGLAMAEALAEAHERGVLHRDLKPANVVIGTDGRVRIVDFGLAKAVQATEEDVAAGVHAISSSTWLVGTPRYMAPEQWEGSDVGGAADVWALGAILFELVSGRRPFEADTTVDLLRLVCSDAPAPRLSSVASVPSKLSQLVSSCLAKEPAERPSPRQVADQLRDILVPSAPGHGLGDGPFRGLLPFGEAHAPLFFGREPEIDAFLERLRRQTIIPVVGPSGVGKSSFVQAGVIPRLREQEGWLVLALRPGPRPFETLAARLERGEAGSGAAESAQLPTLAAVDARAERLQASPRQLALELLELARQSGGKVLLFLDQLEEVFTLVEPDEQQGFLEAIAGAADDLDDPVRVVLTLRHDFIDRLAAVGGAASPLARFFALKSPDRRMLEKALREPVERAGYAFEDDDLVEQMIAAVQGEPACLALLQFAARRLWEQRDEERKILSRSAYEAMGGVGGALARHADAQLHALAPSQERIARSLLQRLVTPERTRRLVPRSEALAGLGRDADSVLERLTEARLVSVIKLRRGEDPRVELTHGSLIHTWRRLAALVEQGEDENRLVEEATQAADLWDKRGRRPEELWRGRALRDAEAHLAQVDVPDQVFDFLRASHQAEQQRIRARRLGRIAAMAGLGLVAAVAVIVSLVIVDQRAEEAAARQRAEERARVAEKEGARQALAAARAAIDARDPSRAREALRQALVLDDSLGARLMWLELSTEPLLWDGPVGAYPTAGEDDPTYHLDASGTLWRVAGERRRIAEGVRAVATGAGRLAYVVDGALIAGSPEKLHAYELLPPGADRLAFDPAGWLEVRAADRVCRWEITLPPDPEPHPGRVVAVALSADGWVSVDEGGTWRRRRDGRTWRAHPSPMGPTSVLALSRDGTQLFGAARGRVTRWSPSKGSAIVEHAVGTSSLAMGPDGALAVADDEGIRIFDPDGKRVTRQVEASGATALALGERWLAAADERRLRVWGSRDDEGRTVAGISGPVVALALHGDRLAVGQPEGVTVVRLDDSDERKHLPIEGVTALSFDDDGRLLFASSDGHLARLDVDDGRRLPSGIVLLPSGKLVTQSAVIDVAKGMATHLADDWVDALQKSARRADQHREGAPLCVATTDGALAVWSTGADRRMGRQAVAGIEDVVGLPSGCALRTKDAVMLSSGGDPKTVYIAGAPYAMGWAEERLLVVSDEAVVTFSESGDILQRHALPGSDATAVTQIGSMVVVGHRDGRLSWLGTQDGSVTTQRGASTSPVSALEAGPRGLVAAGYADGTVALQLPDTVPLWRASLVGPIGDLRVEGDELMAASLGGDAGHWSLGVIDQDRCAVLAALRGGSDLPEGHPCRP